MEYMNRLLTLPPEDYYDEILNLAISTSPLVKYEVENAVAGLYALLNKQPPPIVYCQSPWQMSLIPILKGFLPNKPPDESRVLKEIEELASDNTDFFRLGAAALQSACRTTTCENAGKLLLDECHQLLMKALDELSPSPERLDENPELSEALFSISNFQLDMVLSDTFSRTIVPNTKVGMYVYGQSSLQSRTSGRTRSKSGEYFDAFYRPYYYRIEKTDYGAAGIKDDVIETFNLFTKRASIHLLARLIYDQTLISSSDYVKQILAMMLELVRSAHDYLPFDNICLVSKRPQVVQLDHQMRLHFDSDAALRYSDGYAVYAVEGIVVPSWIIDRPQDITTEKISEEKNTEIKRILMRRFGEARYIRETGAQQIHEDSFGQLYRVNFESPEDDLVMVRVENATPEKDGSRKIYWLRVPPTTQTAKEGVAWSFGMETNEYEPSKSS